MSADLLLHLANLCLATGALSVVLGAVGLLRFPDFYARTHAASMTDTAGAGFILLGLMLYSGANLISLKLLVILIFVLLTSPTAGHALAQAAMVDGLRPQAEIEPENPA